MGKKKNNENKKNVPQNEGGEDKKEAKKVEEIILQVYMHCDECASKVSRCLRGFDGVEEIKMDKANNKVIVKGEKADPDKVLKRIQNKYSRNAQLISPKPKAKSEDQEKKQSENKNKESQVKLVILKMFMHCEGCARDIKKYIIRMKGVLTVEADMGKSQVRVKGEFVPAKLAESIAKGLGKHVEVVKEETTAAVKKTESNYKLDNQVIKLIDYPPQCPFSNYNNNKVYTCQIFSDENVYSCFIM